MVILLGWGAYYFINGIINPPLFVVLEFDELGPIYKRMPVYYKGYKIGITEKIKPSADYKTTLVTVKFYPNDLKLPNNTTAKVKPLTTTRDYIELIYPKKPSADILKTGDKITGSTTLDVQSFMNAQYESGSIGFIIENVSITLRSITKTSDEAAVLLKGINISVLENRKTMQKIFESLSVTTENIRELSEKLNNSISQDSLSETSLNVQKTSENLESITKNLNGTINRLNSVLYNINGVAANANDISADIKASANNRKGLFGILLGTKNSCTQKYANKK
ncbi:MAG: MlaD family protein [bacterium]|nr:MlaD family protein [bacterium]